ncbi:MAG: RNA 2'-phosphotransferase [Candidatus Lokiarchaeota archaeon]|nr:RNA 2'-phosphotransferase [Candidatus Lokiarchaeota archaeon]
MRDDDIKVSKHISFLPRHGATQEGVPIDNHGLVHVDDLLAWLNKRGSTTIGKPDILRVVATNDKQRFEQAGDEIRAVQGHSMAIDADLQPAPPPAALFHGMATRFVPSILATGLLKMGRGVALQANKEHQATCSQRRSTTTIVEADRGLLMRTCTITRYYWIKGDRLAACRARRATSIAR